MVEDAVQSENQPAGRVDNGPGDGVPQHRGAELAAPSTPEVSVPPGFRPPNASSSTAADSSSQNSGGVPPTQQRSTSSKFASLRAAFERSNGSPDGTLSNKRVTSGSEPSVGKASRERSQEYETELAKLRDELEKELELRIAFEEKVTSLEEEMEETERKSAQQSEELAAACERVKQLEQSKDARVDDGASGASEEEAMGHAAQESDSASALRRQLSDLKRSISRSTTRPTGQLTDTALRQEMGLLQHEIQNWVVNNFRRVKIEISPTELYGKLERVAEPQQVERLRPLYEAYETFDAAARLATYQATVAVYVMEIFDDSFLFGLRGSHDWAKRTRQAAETLPAALDKPTYHRWRAMTFSALAQSAVSKELVDGAAGGMAEIICIALNAMTGMEESEGRLHLLKTIVRRAISLAHQVRSQQALYEFDLPVPGAQYEARCMDDVFDDADADDERLVRCATFPSLFKTADDEGLGLDSKKIVFRAKVLCRGDEKAG